MNPTKVMLTVGPWYGQTGTLLNSIPHTDWHNILIPNGMRLALTQEEFAIVPDEIDIDHYMDTIGG